MDVAIKLSEATGVPYYRQIVDQVGQQVVSGTLSPGARMPSVRKLASELLVSLITVRRAYADLEAAGLIVRKQGQGTFVSKTIDEDAAEKARQLAIEDVQRTIRQALQSGLTKDEVRQHVDKTLEEKEA